MTIRSKVILLLALLTVVAGFAAWFYHSYEVDRRASEAKAAREEQARSVADRVMNSWNANDEWENFFSSPTAPLIPYTIEVENALIKGHPLIFYGIVEDVRASGDQGNSVVLVRIESRTKKLNLRLSLISSPESTGVILRDKLRLFDTFVIAATITSVENVQIPPDKYDNDQDYFLAHGTLNEAQPIGSYYPPNK